MKQMQDKVFVDSNIFVYLQSTTDEEKRNISKRVVDDFDCVLSTQVLNEVSNVLSRKAQMSFEQVGEIIEGMVQTCDLVIVSYETIRMAHDIAKDNKLSYYDSLIVASAQEAGCKVLLSEDLTDGQVLGEVKIINIYRHPEMF
jgi:predicted nucleic acid-binding protein